MSWYLIRHGMTADNERVAYVGEGDTPLSENGKAKIRAAAMAGFYPKVEKVYCSPMMRARQTAAIIYPDLEQELIPAFKELSFGRYEGKSFDELQDDEPYMEWVRSDGRLPFPAGEPIEDFFARVEPAFEKIWEKDKDK